MTRNTGSASRGELTTNDLSPLGAHLAQAVCFLLVVGGLGLLGAAIATMWPGMVHPCQHVLSCRQYQLDLASAHYLERHGIGVRGYAIAFSVLLVLTTLIWYGLAALIIWMRPRDRGAVVGALFLSLFPQLALGTLTNSGLQALVGLYALILFGLLFPDGHFRPRWTRWLAVLVIASPALSVLPGSQSALSKNLWVAPVILLPALVAWVQIYRYRRLSSWRERQRSKWAFVGIVSGILSLVALFAIGTVLTSGNAASLGTAVVLAAMNFGLTVVPLVIPISITIGVLRSGLWDIDRVVSRALAYSALTLILVGIYAGGVIGLQALIGLIAGDSSGPAIVLTTLLVAALFGPLRMRVQRVIDKRFYRSRYDAARLLTSFGERLRDQVDIDLLSTDLSSTVHDALHPASVSLWLAEQG